MPSPVSMIHVGTYDHLVGGLHADRATTASKRLLVHVAMAENSTIAQLAIGLRTSHQPYTSTCREARFRSQVVL